MRSSFLTFATALTALAITAKATQLPLHDQEQIRVKSDPSFPQEGSMDPVRTGDVRGDIGVGSGGGVNLADTLTLERRAGLWWDYARDISAVTTRLLASGSTRSTLFVPVDTAIYKMTRKPLEYMLKPKDNIDLPTSSPAQTLLQELSLQVERDGEGWKVQPGDISVVGIKEASNGRILYLDGVIEH